MDVSTTYASEVGYRHQQRPIDAAMGGVATGAAADVAQTAGRGGASGVRPVVAGRLRSTREIRSGLWGSKPSG